MPLGEEAPLAGVPGLALRRERTPNLAGAELLGYGSKWDVAMREASTAGLVIVLDADLDPDDEAALAAAPGILVVLGTVMPEARNAELILPVTNMAEENGTYVNRDRRIQRYQQAKAQPGMARPAWWVAGEVLAGPGPDPSAPSTAAEAFALLGQWWPMLAGITHDDLGYAGRVLGRGPGRSGGRAVTPELKGYILLSVLKMVVVFTIIMIGVALLTLMERKVSAWMQNRHGPNRVGWAGLLQPAADGVKNILKEETLPALANPWLFTVAPALSFIPALLLSAVIPFAAPLPVDFDFTLGPLGRFVHHGPMPMVVAELPVGFLFVLAISSLGVYGIALAGWSSNSKYALLGGLRASAQMVSYEVAMGLSLIPVLLMSGDVSFPVIVAQQQAGIWYVMPLFLSFFIFTVAGFAETNRLPFDLPEAESELITGYHTEYSAMKFSFFFIAEYANVVTVCAMITTLFFGGWDIPFTDWDRSGGLLPTLATWLFFFFKVLFWIFVVMWIRWTLPRFRYDQLMALGWKVMMPLALAYIMVMCTAIYLVERVLEVDSPVTGSLILFGLNVGIALPGLRRARQRRCSSGAPATGNRFSKRAARVPRWRADGDRRESHEASGPAGQLRPGHPQGDGAHLQAHAGEEGDDAVPGAEEHRPGPRDGHVLAVAALARHPPDAHRRAGALEVRGLRVVPPDLPRQLHQAGAGRGRAGEPLPADLRDRRVPLHLLRVLPGGLPRGGDPCRRALRELGVQPWPVRLRPRAAPVADPRRLDALGPVGPRG